MNNPQSGFRKRSRNSISSSSDNILKASVSLDGKLLTASGNPSRRKILFQKIEKARELELTIHPLVVGNNAVPTLSGLPGEFLPEDFIYQLRSAKQQKGNVVLKYRRKGHLKVSRTIES